MYSRKEEETEDYKAGTSLLPEESTTSGLTLHSPAGSAATFGLPLGSKLLHDSFP